MKAVVPPGRSHRPREHLASQPRARRPSRWPLSFLFSCIPLVLLLHASKGRRPLLSAPPAVGLDQRLRVPRGLRHESATTSIGSNRRLSQMTPLGHPFGRALESVFVPNCQSSRSGGGVEDGFGGGETEEAGTRVTPKPVPSLASSTSPKTSGSSLSSPSSSAEPPLAEESGGMSAGANGNIDRRGEEPPAERSHGELLVAEVIRSIDEVSREEWDALVAEEDSPFLEYEWLSCLEKSRCVSPPAGWYPFHLLIREVPPDEASSQVNKTSAVLSGGAESVTEETASGGSSAEKSAAIVENRRGHLIGAIPMYAKTHSMGEFVFDQSWAEAAYYQVGVEYYPKLVAAIPFTPATGKRILTLPDVQRDKIIRTAAQALKQLSDANDFSSVHILFCEEEEAELASDAGYVTRKAVQNHFENKNPLTGLPFESFDEYVKTLKPNRRKALRRERKKIYNEESITIEVFEGDNVTKEVIDSAYDLYEATVEKFYFQRQYLNRDFFRMLQEGPFRKYLAVILAKRGDRTIGGTFNVQKGGTVYGRYWGCFEEVPYLYFEACYYRLIEHVITKNMTRMEAGAGSSGGGKLLRGFDASITRSSHYIRNPSLRAAVQQFVQAEGEAVEEQREVLNEKWGAFKLDNAKRQSVQILPLDENIRNV